MKVLSGILLRFNKRQEGQILIIMLIVLAFSGLLLVPTLDYSASSLKYQEVVETKTLELYSADSGVYAAMIALSSGNTTVDDFELNGKQVSVNLIPYDEGYVITSIASSPGGSNTTIHAYVSVAGGGLMFLFNNAITSKEDVIINPDCTVSGNVTYGQSIEIKPGANVTGAITQDTELDDIWPTADYLKDYFYDDVDTLSPPDGGFVVPGEGGDCPGIEDGVACGKVNPGMYPTIGPLYWDGYLTVKNNVDGNPTSALGGTVYVTDTLKLGTDGKPFTLDLNNQTIFCEKNIITGASDKLTITGSGCIIAIGDIEFKPGLNSSPDDFIFVMSVEGEALIQPLGDLYGSIAGNVNVELKPGNSLEWHDPGDAGFLNFPNEGPLVGSDTEQMIIGGWDIS